MSSGTSPEASAGAAAGGLGREVPSFDEPEILRALVDHVLEGQDYVLLLSDGWQILDANDSFTRAVAPGWRPRATSFLDTLTGAARSQLEGALARGQLDGRALDLFHPVGGGTRWANYRFKSCGGMWLLVGRDQSAQLELAEQLSSLGDELLRALSADRGEESEEAEAEAPQGTEAEPGGEASTEVPLADQARFEEAIASEREGCRGRSAALSLLVADVDRFRQVNAVFGHPIGDLVLERVGAVIRENVRDEDVVFRICGHEFGVILPGLGCEAALEIAERLRSVIEKTRMPRGVWRVTISVGVASAAPCEEDRGKDLAGLARRALQLAKYSGRNCVRCAD
ncbi:MAG: GGDEF domain-containing protein [Planctomycetota bacterium]